MAGSKGTRLRTSNSQTFTWIRIKPKLQRMKIAIHSMAAQHPGPMLISRAK